MTDESANLGVPMNEECPNSDSDLYTRACDGWKAKEPEKVEPFLESLLDRATCYVRSRLRTLRLFDEAEDIVQEGLGRLLRNEKAWASNEDACRAQFYGILGHVITDAIRRASREQRRRKEYAARQDRGDGSPDTLSAAERIAAVNKAIDRLPARMAEVIRLKEFAGESYEVIAQTLGVSVVNARQIAMHARRRLALTLATFNPATIQEGT